MNIRYVGSAHEPRVKLKDIESGKSITLIWGDPVQILEEAADKVKVLGRDKTGWLDKTQVHDRSLLEIYVIDVGQGDAVLFRTPDDKWHLIDGGAPASSQMTRKGAANFLNWKFTKDLGRPGVELASIILTHPDSDHLGGLIDVLSGTLTDGRTFGITVDNYYHSGIPVLNQPMNQWPLGTGSVPAFPQGVHGIPAKGKFVTNLLDQATDFSSPTQQFEGTFAELARLVGSVPKNVQRVSRATGFLPGYDPTGTSGVTIAVLGPVLEDFAPGQQGLRYFGDEGKTRNGHSVILRLDYGAVRVLLTGDLNANSQQLLLSYVPAAEFTVDVTKACHHGAEDVDPDFLHTLAARATVVSSGDNEDYSHPRPALLGACGFYGRQSHGTDAKQVVPPLVYSTELARSVSLCSARSVEIRPKNALDPVPTPGNTWIKPDADDSKFRVLADTPLSNELIYGLVNIRTDGEFIMCATREEKGQDFDVQVFKA